jgi:hypothetical protein
MSKKKESEFERFDGFMRTLIQIPHSAVKAKLDAEKAAKKKRKEKPNDRRDKDNHSS